jgi:hypothetical protein
VKDTLELPRALYHWLRLGYYSAALSHVGHAHPDALELTHRAIESQRVVDAFLEARAE